MALKGSSSMMKKIIMPFLTVVMTTALKSCLSSYDPMEVPFTKWANEDNSLIFYVQYSKCGGNGQALIDSKYEYFLWDCSNYNGLECYFPSLDLYTIYRVENIDGVGFFSNPNENVVYIRGKTSEAPVTGTDRLKFIKQEFDIELDAGNFLSTRFINSDLDIQIHYHINDKKLLVSSEHKFLELKLEFLENKNFSMDYYGKKANGSYETSDTNVFFIFDENQIFDITANYLCFDIEAVVYFC